MTACWSKGRNGHHPYYMCFKKGCGSYRKSIRRDTLEGEFENLLKALQPTEGLYKLARAMFTELWNHQLAAQKSRRKSLDVEILKINRQIEQLLDRIVETQSAPVISAFEKRIEKLEKDRFVLQEKMATLGKPVREFDETFRTAFEFLASPWKIWNSDRLEDKRAVLKLTFADRLRYVRNEGFRTAETTLPFKVLGGLSGSKNKMAVRNEISSNFLLCLHAFSYSEGCFINRIRGASCTKF